MTTNDTQPELQAQFSTLIISLASSAVIALGLEHNPHTGTLEKDVDVARFNIDLLSLLKEKTNGNLTEDERQLLDSVLSDLQIKFVQVSKGT